MLDFLKEQKLYLTLRLFLGGIFLIIGAAKLLNPTEFAKGIGEYGLLPEALLFPSAFVVSILEVLAGLGLLADLKGSLTLLSLLLVMFIGVLVYGIQMGFDIECGCLGSEAFDFLGTTLYHALYRDIALGVICLYLYWWRWMTLTPPNEWKFTMG